MPNAKVNGLNLYYELDSWPLDWPSASVCWPMIAVATREANDRIQPAASMRTATTSRHCSKRLNSRARTWRRSPTGQLALRLATRRPEFFRSLCCQEPPLWSVFE